MMLDKKQIWAVFLFEVKMGCKAAETTHNINNAFNPGTASKHTVQWWFKKFCKGDKSLEDEECSGQPLKVDNNQLERSLKMILLQLHKSCQRAPCRPFYGCSAFEANWKDEKVNASHADHKSKKSSFWRVVFSYFTQQQETISRSDWDVWWEKKSGWYTTISDYQLGGRTKMKLQSTSRSQTCTKKRSWSLFGQDLFWCKFGFGKCFRASFWSNH